jgi:hypothetical protein
MEINDELAREIGVAALYAWVRTRMDGSRNDQSCFVDDGKRKDTVVAGRAALAACREIVLKEALAEPTEKDINGILWEMPREDRWRIAKSLLANRLKSLTHPPSKREQVEAILMPSGSIVGTREQIAQLADKIAAIYGDK